MHNPPLRASSAATYSATERLRDGGTLTIRALRPDDGAALRASFERSSEETRYRRFFAPKRDFSKREVDFYINVDFVGHVALVATMKEGERHEIVGGARYVVAESPHTAEIAFAVDDPHQGLGIGTRLMRHLAAIARDADIAQFVAEVLPENLPMLKVFERCGLPMTTKREHGVVHVVLDLAQVIHSTD